MSDKTFPELSVSPDSKCQKTIFFVNYKTGYLLSFFSSQLNYTYDILKFN